jgi:hypothetical protein
MSEIEIGKTFDTSFDDAEFLAALSGEDKKEEATNNVVEIKEEADPLSFLYEEPKEETAENKEEDKKEDKKEVAAIEKEVIEDNTNESGDVDYENIARVLVEAGEWEEFEFEGVDGKITKEDFEQLRAEQQKIKLEKLREESFDKDEKEFLEFKKNGGDIKAYVNSLTLIQTVDSKLDVTTDEGKKVAVATYYKQIVGWSDEKVNRHIARIEKDLELDEEAEMAEKEIKSRLKENHDNLIKEAQYKAAKIEEDNRTYKETLKETVKSKKFETKQVNQILRDVVEKDERGLAEVDKKYIELRNNPELIVDLWEYLFNREKLVEKIKKETATTNNREVFKKIVIGKRSKDTKNNSQDTNEKREVVVPIPINNK